MTDDYISWLQSFTLKNNFTDIDWVYFPDNISKSDYSNVEKLHLFFEIINEYAKNNNIDSVSLEDQYGSSYYILFNNTILEIGFMSGQGTLFYCNIMEMLNKTQKNSCIDYNDIKTGKKRAVDNSKLNSLSDYIRFVSQSVSIEDIEKEVLNTIDSIKQENNKSKTLKLKK